MYYILLRKEVPREKGNCDPAKEDAFVNITAEI